MREPNFSESQLQQAVNTAYIRHVYKTHKVWVFANVPSLFDEFELGWDTAFHFPWYKQPPLADHEGCNFFLQYKLSFELTSAGAREWPHWNAEYYRFKIPHSTKNAAGKFHDDYHQWDRLKELANQNYPTYYATNSTLSKDVLRSSSKVGTLLDNIALLDIRKVANQHKHVTFTPSSKFFRLHSEVEESEKTSFSSVVITLAELDNRTMEQSSQAILESLQKIGLDDEGWNSDLAKIHQVRNVQAARPLQASITQSLISSFVRKHLGAQMLWLPANG
jgi:hypothetical protein